MREDIIIKGDQNTDILSVGLIEILNSIDNGGKYYWKILWIEANGSFKGDTILNFEKKINESESGYLISFSRLIELTASLSQIIELLLIGSEDIKYLIRYESTSEMRNNCDFCIELVDSSYWEISTNNSATIKKMQQELLGVESTQF